MNVEFPKHPDLAKKVSKFLERTGMSRAKLGINALSDSGAIYNLEAGRELRQDTQKRLLDYMKKEGRKK